MAEDKAEDKSIVDKAKDVAETMKEKVSDFVGQHEEKIDSAIDKTGGFVDEKVTRGKFTEKIDRAEEALKGAVSKVAGSNPDEGESGKDEPGKDETPPAE